MSILFIIIIVATVILWFRFTLYMLLQFNCYASIHSEVRMVLVVIPRFIGGGDMFYIIVPYSSLIDS